MVLNLKEIMVFKEINEIVGSSEVSKGKGDWVAYNKFGRKRDEWSF